MRRRAGPSGPADGGDWGAEPPGLSVGDVHVWFALLDQAPGVRARLRTALSAGERARAGRFHFPGDQERFGVCRGLLREILGRYLRVLPALLQFDTGPNGKPSLALPGCGLRFNLSHAGGLAVFALAREREVGVDIEPLRPFPDAEPIARRFFSSGEYRAYCATGTEGRDEAFLRYWTCKEAFLKASGFGLASPPEQVEVALGDPPRLVSVAGDRHEANRWSLHNLAPAEGFLGALCVEGGGATPRIRWWPEGDGDWPGVGMARSLF